MNNRRQPKQYRQKTQQTKAPLKKTKIEKCCICRKQLGPNESFTSRQCPRCYQGLFYYVYTNMFLFVEKDETYMDLYFPNPSRTSKPIRKASIETAWSDPETEDDEDSDEVDLAWVDNLLANE